ncbi:hypothetical protein O77CONTIG1_03830 [Leptolyngbya sp. O-77]|nr:hypothetical protein O77CONTIG1_03830 [Leptolyngbya sp. O-77]
MDRMSPEQLKPYLSRVKLLALDVDGVMTDGGPLLHGHRAKN